jgi:hypothetical protein
MILLVRASLIVAAESVESATTFALPLVESSGFFGDSEHKLLQDIGLSIKADRALDAGFTMRLDKCTHGKKIQLHFRKIIHFRYLAIDFCRLGEPFTRAKRAVINFDVPDKHSQSPVYEVRIPDGDLDQMRLSFRRTSVPGEAVIESITAVPLGLWDNAAIPYVVVFGIGIMLFFPGVLLYVLYHKGKLSETEFQLSLLGYSLLFYITVYIFLFASLALGITISQAHSGTLIFCSTLFAIMLQQVSKKHAWGDLTNILQRSWREITAYTLLLFVLCLIVTHHTNLPIQNMYYRDIAGPKTFGAFNAHDGMFQYANGLAIADNEPFKKYYGNKILAYNVEDREMLPGVIYAVFRALLSPLSGILAGSYFVYTLLGIAMNLMLLFPAAAIAKRYLGISNTFLLLLLLSANAFMICNYMITWFKLTGAALFLSGLYYIFRTRMSYGDWAKSGMFFGLGANMHAGVALGIPLFFLWAAWRGFREHGILKVRSFLGPLLLVLVFAVALLPWSSVKRIYFHDENVLIKQHFLGGYSSPKGLGESARLFLENTPLQQQCSNRLDQLVSLFRFYKFEALVQKFREHGTKAFLLEWDIIEFNYIAFALYPGALFALLSWIFGRFKDQQTGYLALDDSGKSRSILIISVFTMVFVILAHYGRSPADIVYQQPMGVLVLANLVLLAIILRSVTTIKIAYFGYTAFVLYRLGLFF